MATSLQDLNAIEALIPSLPKIERGKVRDLLDRQFEIVSPIKVPSTSIILDKEVLAPINAKINPHGLMVDQWGHLIFLGKQQDIGFNLLVMRHGATPANGEGIINEQEILGLSGDNSLLESLFKHGIIERVSKMEVQVKGKLEDKYKEINHSAGRYAGRLIKILKDSRIKRLQGNVDVVDKTGTHGLNQLWEKSIEDAQQAAVKLLEMIKDLEREGKSNSKELIILTSQLRRSKQTAEPFIALAKKEGYEVTVVEDEGANEMSYGDYNNQRATDLEYDPEAVEFFQRYRGQLDVTVRPRNGASYIDEVIKRIQWIDRLKKYKGKTLILIGHGANISTLRAALRDPVMINNEGFVDYQKNILGNTNPTLLQKIQNKETNKGVSIPDAAMPGGIDLNRQRLQMNVQKDGGINAAFNIDPAMLQQLQSHEFDGFDFTIDSITPIPSVKSLLHLNIS